MIPNKREEDRIAVKQFTRRIVFLTCWLPTTRQTGLVAQSRNWRYPALCGKAKSWAAYIDSIYSHSRIILLHAYTWYIPLMHLLIKNYVSQSTHTHFCICCSTILHACLQFNMCIYNYSLQADSYWTIFPLVKKDSVCRQNNLNMFWFSF